MLSYTPVTCCKCWIWRVQGSGKVVCLTGWKSICLRQYGPSIISLWRINRNSYPKNVFLCHNFSNLMWVCVRVFVCVCLLGASAVAHWAQTDPFMRRLNSTLLTVISCRCVCSGWIFLGSVLICAHSSLIVVFLEPQYHCSTVFYFGTAIGSDFEVSEHFFFNALFLILVFLCSPLYSSRLSSNNF